MPDHQTKDDVYLNSGQVREMFGNISFMALHRWQRREDLSFPKPTKIASRNYWSRRAVLEFRDRMERAGS